MSLCTTCHNKAHAKWTGSFERRVWVFRAVGLGELVPHVERLHSREANWSAIDDKSQHYDAKFEARQTLRVLAAILSPF